MIHLAGYYDTVAEVRGVPYDAPSGDVAAAFTSFCLTHRRELEHLVATRTTQTNEVGRCSALLPGLCEVASRYSGKFRSPCSTSARRPV